MKFEHAATFWMHDCFPWVVSVCIVCHFTEHSSPPPSSPALKMASILQKLITPLFSGPPEPPRNKVTVVGVGQVGMACAVSILLRVRAPLVSLLLRLSACLLVSQDGVIHQILLDWRRITLLVSDLAIIPSLSWFRCDWKIHLSPDGEQLQDFLPQQLTLIFLLQLNLCSSFLAVQK